MLQTQTKSEPRSKRPSKLHSPLMMQQHKLKSLMLHSTKTGRTLQDLINTSSHSPSAPFTPESLITMPYQNSSSMDLTHKLWYNSLSQKQSKPLPPWRNFTPKLPRLKEVIAVLHYSGKDPNYPMEEVVITMTTMLWMCIALYYPQSNELTTWTKIAASYVIKKGGLLGITLVTITIA